MSKTLQRRMKQKTCLSIFLDLANICSDSINMYKTPSTRICSLSGFVHFEMNVQN